jgi:hypothetical protein
MITGLVNLSNNSQKLDLPLIFINKLKKLVFLFY